MVRKPLNKPRIRRNDVKYIIRSKKPKGYIKNIKTVNGKTNFELTHNHTDAETFNTGAEAEDKAEELDTESYYIEATK